jgi:hypothetical protein
MIFLKLWEKNEIFQKQLCKKMENLLDQKITQLIVSSYKLDSLVSFLHVKPNSKLDALIEKEI